MRTPGSDFELAAGFLHAEGIIERAEQISDMEFCVGPGNRDRQFFNIVSVRASRLISPTARASDFERRAAPAVFAEKRPSTNSSCAGYCRSRLRLGLIGRRLLGSPTRCAIARRSSRRPADYTVPLWRPRTATCWPCAKMLAGTTRSINSLVGCCSMVRIVSGRRSLSSAAV